MEKYFKTVLLALTITTNTLAQSTVETDTVEVEHPDKVVITQSDESLKVVVTGCKDNPGFRLERNIVMADSAEVITTETKHESTGLSFGLGSDVLDINSVEKRHTPNLVISIYPAFEFGFATPVSGDKSLKTSFWKSYEARLNLMRWKFLPKKGRWWLTLDLGLSRTHFSLCQGCFSGDDDYNLMIGSYPQDYSKGESGVTLWGGDLTLLYHQQLGKYSSMAFGLMYSGYHAPINNNAYAKYVDGSGKEVTNMYRIDPNRNTITLRAEYSPYHGVIFYVGYTPWSMFRNGRGPKFSTLTFGMGLNI